MQLQQLLHTFSSSDAIALHRKTDAGAKKVRDYCGWVVAGLQAGFTELIKVCRFCGIVNRFVQIIHCLLGVQFLKLQVQFRHLLPQLGVPQLLEDVVVCQCM